MPYAFAHPAAVVPVAKVLGRHAVPSALAIGSMVPDAWYLVPYLERSDSHDLAGVLWFCLPLAYLFYFAFHLVFKQPLLALLPPSLSGRLAALTPPGLPSVPAAAVLVSLLAGIATHLAWDALTHQGHPLLEARLHFGIRLHQLTQHASTLVGTAFLGWWIWGRVRATKPAAHVPQAGPAVRIAVLASSIALPALAFFYVAGEIDGPAWRTALRAGAVTAASALGFVGLAFCVAWRARSARAGR